MTAEHKPLQPGDRIGGEQWTGVAWAYVCPTDGLPLTEYSETGDVCCPTCGITDREVQRILRAATNQHADEEPS